ncbi:hypothetical protein STCU_09103, partial [Strigomonas culicis]
MDKLTALLRSKVARERQTGTPPPAPGSGTSKTCWLCSTESKLRFRLKDTSALCFTCFRTAYMALVLPRINTPARRKSDDEFLKAIDALQHRPASSVASKTSERSDVYEVVDPSQASFVMSASVIKLRNSQNPRETSGAAGQGGMWNCPRCTYINTVFGSCTACGFVNTGQLECPLCRRMCPTVPTKAGDPTSRCSSGKPHIVWRCDGCANMNTVDGDHCRKCTRPRYWACSQCTALHNTRRTDDGLRYCSTCGAYNTPEDVGTGQAKLQEEHDRAERIRQQQSESEVVFGVNDTETLEEQHRQAEIKDNEQRLLSRLSHLHLKLNAQKMDGNCLFSALAHQLFGNPRLHHLVRSLVVAYMKENSKDYSMLFTNAEWQDYTNHMRELGYWGDEVCLNAAARCFGVNIHVITSDVTRWHTIFQHDILGDSQTNLRPMIETEQSATQRSPCRGHVSPPLPADNAVCLFLAYKRPVHFDDITPSPVESIVLSDLLLPELSKMLAESGPYPPPPSHDGGPPHGAQPRRASLSTSSPTGPAPGVPRTRGNSTSPSRFPSHRS